MPAKKSADSPAQSDEPSFEAALARLEEIAGELEEGKLGLAESLACYEEGVKHLARCYKLLEQAERKIELLAGVDAEGNAIVRPFDDAATTFEEQTPARSKSRSQPPPVLADTGDVKEGEVDDEELLF